MLGKSAQARLLERFVIMAAKKPISLGFVGTIGSLFKQTFSEWLADKAPQLGAALAYYTVFSLAPLVIVLLAIVGFIFRNDPAGAWQKVTEQMSYFLDRSAVEVVQNIAAQASHPSKGLAATIIGVALALFGASGVFGQLQDALNTIWDVKPKPGAGIAGYLRTRFLSFALVAGICFLLLVSLTIETILKSLSHFLQGLFPGGLVLAMSVYLVFDLAVVTLFFADHLQISARREGPLARRLVRRVHDRGIFRHRKMGARAIPRQWERRLGLRRGKFADHFAPVGLLLFADSTFRRGIYSSLVESLWRRDRAVTERC